MPHWFIISTGSCFVCLFLIIQKLYHPPFITENPKYLIIQRVHYFYFTLSDCWLSSLGFFIFFKYFRILVCRLLLWVFLLFSSSLPNLYSLLAFYDRCFYHLSTLRALVLWWEWGYWRPTQICFTKKEALVQTRPGYNISYSPRH